MEVKSKHLKMEMSSATNLCMLYKINHQQVSIDVQSHYVPPTTSAMQTRKRYSEHYAVITIRTDKYRHSYFNSTIPIWNQLPSSAVTPPSTKALSTQIQEAFYSGQSELYMDSTMPTAISNWSSTKSSKSLEHLSYFV